MRALWWAGSKPAGRAHVSAASEYVEDGQAAALRYHSRHRVGSIERVLSPSLIGAITQNRLASNSFAASGMLARMASLAGPGMGAEQVATRVMARPRVPTRARPGHVASRAVMQTRAPCADTSEPRLCIVATSVAPRAQASYTVLRERKPARNTGARQEYAPVRGTRNGRYGSCTARRAVSGQLVFASVAFAVNVRHPRRRHRRSRRPR